MKYATVLLTVLLLATFLIYSAPYGRSANSTIIVPDDYSTIQAAVDTASPGDTVFVRAGIYHENVIVDRSIFLIGENAETTIIDGVAASGTIVSIKANNVTVSGFTIKSHSDSSDRGLVLSSSNFSNIDSNFIIGVWQEDAVVLEMNSSHNILFGNYIAKALSCGIILRDYSRGNRIINNTIRLCYDFAIFLNNCCNESVIFHNSFINDFFQVRCLSSPNVFDDGYPSGGNLWAGYIGADLYKGPGQNILGSDGICDAPYTKFGGKDRYPLFVPGQNATIRFYIEPSSLTVRKGQTFNVTVKLDNIPEYPGFTGAQFRINWNSSVLNGVGISEIVFHAVAPEGERDNIWLLENIVTARYALYTCLWQDTSRALWKGYMAIWGNHSVATITLKAVGEGTCVLNPVLVIVGSEEADVLISTDYSSPLNQTITGCAVEVKNRNPGDCNYDSRVDMLDMIILSNSFGTKLGDPKYNEAADQNSDGVVNICDVILGAANFGKTYQ